GATNLSAEVTTTPSISNPLHPTRHPPHLHLVGPIVGTGAQQHQPLIGLGDATAEVSTAQCDATQMGRIGKHIHEGRVATAADDAHPPLCIEPGARVLEVWQWRGCESLEFAPDHIPSATRAAEGGLTHLDLAWSRQPGRQVPTKGECRTTVSVVHRQSVAQPVAHEELAVTRSERRNAAPGKTISHCGEKGIIRRYDQPFAAIPDRSAEHAASAGAVDRNHVQ